MICHRYKSAYLVDIETNKVLQEYQSNQSKDEEMLYCVFSGDYEHIYAYSSTKNLYVFERKSGKLESIILIPTDKAEISGMELGTIMNQDNMVVYTSNNLFKLA